LTDTTWFDADPTHARMTDPDAAETPDAMPDVLARICDLTREEVARRSLATPLRELKSRLRERLEPPRGFGQALKRRTAEGRLGLIAEIKKASPSAGLIRPDYDPAGVARQYETAGAACLSVLTEGPSFQGCLADLATARDAVSLPVLRKDFILDPWQIYESRVAGADCILLIMAALSDSTAAELLGLARSLDMDVLVEVHDEPELMRALGLNTDLIGINNRNLKTLRTDLSTSFELVSLVPPDKVVVSESGIASRADVERLEAAGASCFLVGESLLRQADAGAACRALLGT
jgi:indole-3-glycerol phosphate synthase